MAGSGPLAPKKATVWDGFGNDFGNKGVVTLQTLVIPIDMAERVSNNPYVGFRQIYIGLCADGHPKLPYAQIITHIT